jgi:hypothetical protein
LVADDELRSGLSLGVSFFAPSTRRKAGLFFELFFDLGGDGFAERLCFKYFSIIDILNSACILDLFFNEEKNKILLWFHSLAVETPIFLSLVCTGRVGLRVVLS